MKILIAGGAGFIGSHIVEKALMEGLDIGVLVRNTTNLWRLYEVERLTGKKIQKLVYTDYGDLLNIVRDYSPDVVINLAAYYKKYHTYEDIVDMTRSMIEFATHLLDASVSAGVPKFISAGTCFQYDFTLSLLNERSFLNPFDLYAAFKNAWEEIAKYYAHNLGINIVILRLFFVYGHRDSYYKLLPRVMMADKGDVFHLTSDDQEIDYVFVEDVARAFLLAALKKMKTSFEVFNVGSGNAYKLKIIIDYILSKINNPPQIIWNQQTRSDIDYVRADITKIRNYLGWYPMYSIYQGLDKMLEYYKKGGKKNV